MPGSLALHAAGLTGLLALSLVVPEGLPAPPRPPIGDVVFATGPRAPTPARPLQPIARNPRGDRRVVTPVREVPVDVPPLEPEAFAPDDAIAASDARCAKARPVEVPVTNAATTTTGREPGRREWATIPSVSAGEKLDE